MAALAAGKGVALRPHAKTHKSPEVAHLQAARGAVGQCVQKVGEAEVLAWGGVGDILVSNEAVGDRKLARFAALSDLARIAICARSESILMSLGWLLGWYSPISSITRPSRRFFASATTTR